MSFCGILHLHKGLSHLDLDSWEACITLYFLPGVGLHTMSFGHLEHENMREVSLENPMSGGSVICGSVEPITVQLQKPFPRRSSHEPY